MKIGLLIPGHAPEEVRARLGDYADMYERLLAGYGFDFARWSVVDNDFPDGPEEADGWLIGGSRHGVYEDHAWIAPLEQLIRDITAADRPLVGICFGHQIIAKALGGKVEKYSGGWALGPTEYDFAGTSLTLNAWHQDQVVAPPPGAEVIAANAFCRYAGIRMGDKTYSVQPHPEYDAEMMRGLFDFRAETAGVPPAQVAEARARLDQPLDAGAMADRIAAFFKRETGAMAEDDWTGRLPEAAREYLEGHRLDEVECVIADLPGIARGKAVPAGKFLRQEYFHLPESIFYQTITGDWVEDDELDYVERDMILRPDMSTATAAPWTADWTLQVIHDAYDRKGRPIQAAPRNVLKRVVALYEKQGWDPVVAPEMEFYLVARNLDPAKRIEPMMGRSGRPAAARQAYSMTAVDEFGPVIDDIYDFAEAQGFEIDGITQEGGAGQLEINLRHGDPVKLADEVFYFKRLIREAALRHDCFATFMAKPIGDEPGSAMHVHHSIVERATGHNLFSGPQGGDTDAFFHFIAGLQNHLPSVISLLAPYVNSYRRYVRDHAAPINLEWGRDNRTTGIRIPLSSPESRRVENRLSGMDANPYLAIAASLAAGYLGLMEERRPSPQFRRDAYEDSEADIPRDLAAALELLEAAEGMHELLGPEFVRIYTGVKRAEHAEFLGVISPWEREHLLLNV